MVYYGVHCFPSHLDLYQLFQYPLLSLPHCRVRYCPQSPRYPLRQGDHVAQVDQIYPRHFPWIHTNVKNNSINSRCVANCSVLQNRKSKKWTGNAGCSANVADATSVIRPDTLNFGTL